MDSVTHTTEGLETGPMIPNPIPVRIRMSRTHFVLGNVGFAILLYAVATREIPLWAVVVITAVAAVGLAALTGSRTHRNNQRYLTQRMTELAPYFPDREAAQPYAVQDRSAYLHVSSPNPLFTVPSFVLALIFLYFTFEGVDDALKLQDWSGFFRWPTALVAAGAHGLLLLLVWASVNYTPALVRFDLQRIRREYDHVNEQEEIVTRLGAEDHNDIQISQQQAHLESLHRRVETYTLESALLSALSFSSFLTIAIAEGRDKETGYLDNLRTVFAVDPDWRQLPFSFTLPGDIAIDHFPLPPNGYFIDHAIALISLALLMCATTFLGVLVARLRFNDGYRDADSVLKAAERLNKKQDAASASGDQKRIDNYGSAIATMLEKCDHLQSGLDLMLTYMRFSRNTGILFFTGALILCGLLFSMVIAVVIGVVMACAFLVGYIDDLVRSIRRRSVFNENGIGSLLKPFQRRRPPQDR